MKKAFSAKNVFLKIFLPICAAILFSACDLFQESPKDFLEDYSSIATVATYAISGNAIPQGAWLNVASDENLTITYFVDNPGNHRLRAEIKLSNGITFTPKFPENENGELCQTWIEETVDDEGNVTQTSHTENETDFLLSTFSIEIPSSSLAGIDGDVSQFNISPTVTLYRADFGEKVRMQSLHTISLRCNTPPAPIEDVVGQMFETAAANGSEFQKLVLAIKLPALKADDKYLTVSENGRTHIFDAHFANGDASSDGLWTISSIAPANMKPTYTGGPMAASIGANWFIATDINIKGRSPFGITLTLTDAGGLSSSRTFTSHGQKCLPPTSSSTSPLAQSESDGMATYTLKAESGATIHYTVEKADGVYSEGSGASPLAIKLPVGTFDISAYATKPGFEKSEDFTANSINVTSSVFFVSADGSDTDGNGSKLKPFATIEKAEASFASPAPASPEDAKIFLLSDLEITEDKSYSNIFLQGCAGGSKGSRVTISCNLSLEQAAFSIRSGSVEMRDLNITQTSSRVIASGISVESGATLDLQNVSITGMKTSGGAVTVTVNGTLNISGGVKITGNTTAGGAPKNLYLPDGKTFNIQGSLAGTQIGVSTETKPVTNSSVTITSGYKDAGGSSSSLNSNFISDEGFSLKMENEEAVLTANGGSIGINPPAAITFSFDSTEIKSKDSGDGGGITIFAFGDGTIITDMTKFTTFTADIYLGSVSIGKRFNNNSFRFEPSGNLDNGTYVIKITAIYGGTEFSGELTYEYTKTS